MLRACIYLCMPLAAVGCTETRAPDAIPDAGDVTDAGRPADDAATPTPDASARDASAPDASGEPVSCPPTGPFGTSTGEIVPDVTLLDCEGNPHSLHDLCTHEVAWVFEYTDWCPPCRDFAERAESIYQARAGEDLAAFFVIAENDSFGAPTAELCAAIRERYGLTMTVLYDPTQSFSETLGVPVNDFHLVMTRGNVVHWTGRYADAQIEARLEDAFGR